MPELIDRDALMRKYTTSFAHDNKHNTVEELRFLLECIRTAPTIEPEARHGRWTDNGEDKFICSVCRGYVYRWFGKSDFCPNCGARMDGGADNANN